MRRVRATCVVAVGLASVLASALAVAPASAGVREMTDDPAWPRPAILALANDGTIVGWSGDQSRTSRAFRWKDGRFTRLDALPGDRASEGWGVSPSGAVAGTSWTADTTSQAVVWPAGSSTPKPLGYLAGAPMRSQAYSINDAGNAVGGAYVAGAWARPAPALYAGGAVQDLQPGQFSEAAAINGRGTIIGGPFGGGYGAFVVRGGTLSPISCIAGSSLMNKLSENDVVVGSGPGNEGPMRWENGTCTKLPVPGDALRAVPQAINASGTAVGVMALKGSKENDDDGVALLWPASGGVVRLDTLLPKGSGWKLKGTFDINDAGQVVGEGERNGEAARFVLTPDGPRTTVTAATTRGSSSTVRVAVRCSVACRATVSATVRVRGAKRAIPVKAITRSLTAGKTPPVVLSLPRAARRTVAAALRKGRRVTATVVVTTKDDQGRSTTTRRTVRLRR